uniref:Putative thyroglobulin type i repeat protein n=1 Tax=Xenopsylla cheopis TaxID=163159 RepID=A0A6M2DWG9_XENCH
MLSENIHVPLRKVSVFLFILVAVKLCAGQDLRCSEAFCEDYKDNEGCLPVPDECLAQNQTHNGALFPSPTPCNCCQTCLKHLKEKDECSLGRPGVPTPESICGPGLICVDTPGSHPICEKDTSRKCYKEQKDYDDKKNNGTVGKYEERPKCDERGNYKPVKCIQGQTCYCVSEDGERIFGEDIYSQSADLLMNCRCSRAAHIASQLNSGWMPYQPMRCSSTGSFEQLQCLDDFCMCVYPVSGDPVSNPVNMTTDGLSKLDCYNEKEHPNTTYLRNCEKELLDQLKDIAQRQKDGFIVLEYELQQCQPDGWYAPVKTEKDKKICVNKFGGQIETYEAQLNSPEALNMNCKCARTKWLLNSTLPQCANNGNFKPKQCIDKECWCVDEDGNQIEKETTNPNCN